MPNKVEEMTLNSLSAEIVPWQVVGGKTRNKTKTQRTNSKVKNEVKFQVHLNHFYDVKEVPFDILVDVPAENCINCLGPRHFKCDKPQSHDYCFNCGRSGVRVNTCPRCRCAYPKYLEKRKKAGFGRDAAKTKVNEIQNKPVQPDLEVLSTTPVIAETEANAVSPVDKEFSPWASAVKFSSTPQATNSNKISLNDQNVQLINNNFGLCNGYMVRCEKLFIFTGEYLKDLANLLSKIKNLAVPDQDKIVLQFITERRKLVDQRKLTAVQT